MSTHAVNFGVESAFSEGSGPGPGPLHKICHMTVELFVTGGFRKPNVQKNLFKNNYEREKGPYLLFQKLYNSTWIVATDFCSINLVEGEVNETPRGASFIHDPFHKASHRENLNGIEFPLTFVQDCSGLMSKPFVKVNFVVVDVSQAQRKTLTGH